MEIYGIKTCGSVKKALKFFKDHAIEYHFVDFKQSPPDCSQIDRWIAEVGIERLFNNRGTKYRTLKLKELNLDETGKREWLCREFLLIKRPVIEQDDGTVIVAFDEEKYREIFLT